MWCRRKPKLISGKWKVAKFKFSNAKTTTLWSWDPVSAVQIGLSADHVLLCLKLSTVEITLHAGFKNFDSKLSRQVANIVCWWQQYSRGDLQKTRQIAPPDGQQLPALSNLPNKKVK
jgi:hypothetical protein